MSARVKECQALDARDTSESLADHLDRRIQTILGQLEGSEAYRVVADRRTDPRFVAAIVRWYLLEVFSFGAHVIEATFTAIGRMPKTRPDLMRGPAKPVEPPAHDSPDSPLATISPEPLPARPFHRSAWGGNRPSCSLCLPRRVGEELRTVFCSPYDGEPSSGAAIHDDAMV